MNFSFTRDRYRHTLLKQAGDVCLVERTSLVTDSVHWEVVRLQAEPEQTIKDKVYPAHLRYPGNEEWGTHGWTFTDITNARQKWAALVPGRAQKGGSAVG